MIETPSIQWFPGHMTKTKRLMEKSIRLVDAVVELLDARTPFASRNPDLGQMIGNKKRVILLNKADLADPILNLSWKEYYENEGFETLLIDSQSGKGLKEFLPAVRRALKEELLKKEERGMSGQAIRLMIVGIPNVGKSSLINRLSGTKSTAVANRPGVTRGEQWVTTSLGIELLDTAGVLWPKFEDKEVAKNLAFTGAIKDDIMDIETLSMLLLETLALHYGKNLAERYRLSEDEMEGLDGYDLLEQVGKKRGMLLPGGNINLDRAAVAVLDDFRSGKLGKITLEMPL